MKLRSNAMLIDFVNIVLGLATWIFPDIPLASKVIVGIVLIGIAVIAHANPDFVGNHVSAFRIAALWTIPILIGVAEWFVVGKMVYGRMYPEYSIESDPTTWILAGFIFGIFVGLPLVLWGANVRKEREQGVEESPGKVLVAIGIVGSIFQCTLASLLAGLVEKLPSWLNSTVWPAKLGLLGPAPLLVIRMLQTASDQDNPLFFFLSLFVLAPILMCLQGVQFSIIGYLLYSTDDT